MQSHDNHCRRLHYLKHTHNNRLWFWGLSSSLSARVSTDRDRNNFPSLLLLWWLILIVVLPEIWHFNALSFHYCRDAISEIGLIIKSYIRMKFELHLMFRELNGFVCKGFSKHSNHSCHDCHVHTDHNSNQKRHLHITQCIWIWLWTCPWDLFANISIFGHCFKRLNI